MDNNDVIYCPNCGKPNDKNYKFCSNCGTPLVNTQQEINSQIQQPCTDTTEVGDLNQSEINKNPRKFSFLIVLGIIQCFYINKIIGIVVLLLYLIYGNEKNFLGKILKVLGFINLMLIVLVLILLGTCMFTFTDFL